jgi:hypothetical protein
MFIANFNLIDYLIEVQTIILYFNHLLVHLIHPINFSQFIDHFVINLDYFIKVLIPIFIDFFRSNYEINHFEVHDLNFTVIFHLYSNGQPDQFEVPN